MFGFKQHQVSKIIYAPACILLLSLFSSILLAEQKPISGKQSLEEQRAALKQRKQSLKLQYQKLQKTLAEEDAFSPNLAETYLSYGLLLQQDGQYEEAVEALKNAAHIKKVNNGIYSSEQLPVLKAKFEVQRILGDEEAYKETIKQILFVESKNPKADEDISFELLLGLGYDYLNNYYQISGSTQRKLDTLSSAKYYYSTALSKFHKKVELSKLPYSELALISYLQSEIEAPYDTANSITDSRFSSVSDFSKNMQMKQQAYQVEIYRQGLNWLKHYRSKAEANNDSLQAVSASLALADYNQLTDNKSSAVAYYREAWQKNQMLDLTEIQKIDFSKPVALPSFNYLQPLQTKTIKPRYSIQMVPVKLTISSKGKVVGVKQVVMEGELADSFKKARSAARRITFRPKIVNGEAVTTEDFEYSVRVYQRIKLDK